MLHCTSLDNYDELSSSPAKLCQLAEALHQLQVVHPSTAAACWHKANRATAEVAAGGGGLPHNVPPSSPPPPQTSAEVVVCLRVTTRSRWRRRRLSRHSTKLAALLLLLSISLFCRKSNLVGNTHTHTTHTHTNTTYSICCVFFPFEKSSILLLSVYISLDPFFFAAYFMMGERRRSSFLSLSRFLSRFSHCRLCLLSLSLCYRSLPHHGAGAPQGCCPVSQELLKPMGGFQQMWPPPPPGEGGGEEEQAYRPPDWCHPFANVGILFLHESSMSSSQTNSGRLDHLTAAAVADINIVALGHGRCTYIVALGHGGGTYIVDVGHGRCTCRCSIA
eukprot:GHVS01101715.1.p1 GENE.GHVS01101715.1~~GHVS01101715.1.p1  ORF type:complete len:333 (+),score=71.31 GHVS01101715.1:703-1701(+)